VAPLRISAFVRTFRRAYQNKPRIIPEISLFLIVETVFAPNRTSRALSGVGLAHFDMFFHG